jgi:hypothetical protein
MRGIMISVSERLDLVTGRKQATDVLAHVGIVVGEQNAGTLFLACRRRRRDDDILDNALVMIGIRQPA